MTSLVVIKGAGDLGTGVAYRLVMAGFAVVMTELPQPLCVRRTVSLAEAVVTGRTTVEGLTAVRAGTLQEAYQALAARQIPVVVDPGASVVAALRPQAVVDAIMAKRNTGTRISDAPVVVALGPGFTAGVDCHAVVETQRGHDLGRVYYQGQAHPDTGVPGELGGITAARVLKASAPGVFVGTASIGQLVKPGQVVGYVEAAQGRHPVVAAIGGVVRGLLRDGTSVAPGLKVGDIDPSGDESRCYRISDKALAVGGGVLEALLHLGCRPAAVGLVGDGSKETLAERTR